MILTRNNDLPTPLVSLWRMRERVSINFAIDIRFPDNVALNYRPRLISLLEQMHHGLTFFKYHEMKKSWEMYVLERVAHFFYLVINKQDVSYVSFNGTKCKKYLSGI
ncbi:uncharacterized protein LOC143143728 [Ptiloglossa arizonensis]|uniref:uncharacterized protein LOC143143728 n=1 Tax=Ptiloglossa arizonensis TaxID=3350558 RepID=UPI003F9FC206